MIQHHCHGCEGVCDKNQSYIGKTKKHLSVSVQEHLFLKSGKSAIMNMSFHVRTVTLTLSATYILYLKPTQIFEDKIKEGLYRKIETKFRQPNISLYYFIVAKCFFKNM